MNLHRIGPNNNMKTKRCSKCGKHKSLSEFHRNKSEKDGLRYSCKACISKNQRIRLEKKNPDAKRYLVYSQKHRTINNTEQKFCIKCEIWKPINKFYKCKRHKDSLALWCKNCEQEYHQAHKTKEVEYGKEYRRTHKIKRVKQQKEYRQSINGCLNRCFHRLNQRCNNPEHQRYKYYGGRSIKCLFKSSDEFINYVVNVLKVDPRGLEVHRINNDGHYELGNIEFLTRAEHKAKHKEMRKHKHVRSMLNIIA